VAAVSKPRGTGVRPSHNWTNGNWPRLRCCRNVSVPTRISIIGGEDGREHTFSLPSGSSFISAAWRDRVGAYTGATAPPALRFEEGDLKLDSGETIKDFAISYVTHGKLNEKKSNAVLMTSSIGGNHHRIDFLIGPGKALDTDKYFIIATDAIGNWTIDLPEQ
jgi:hypothetical protein